MAQRFVRNESGVTMGLTVIMIVLIGVMGAGLLTFVSRDLDAVVQVNQGQKAFEMADAGVKAAKRQLISDPDPKRYDGSNIGIVDSDWAYDPAVAGGDGVNLNMEGNTVNVQIQSDTPSPGLYTVVSTGGSAGDAKRRVEAVYRYSSSLGVPASYFTRTNLTLRGSARTSGISLFALGNVAVEGGARIGDVKDEYFQKWAATNDTYTYPNSFNSTARPTEKAGIGALGNLTVTGNAATVANIAKGTKSFDRATNPRVVGDFAADGTPGQQSTELAFPFNTAENAADINALRRRAQALEAATGDDYYRDGVSGNQTISNWPSNSDYDTVVFYEFASYSSTNNVSYTDNGTCTPPENKGIIVVNRGNFSVAGGTQFSGGILVYGGGTPDVSKGTYSSTGNGCLTGYANSTGLLDIGGNPTAGAVPALNTLPALADGMTLLSWRELYQ